MGSNLSLLAPNAQTVALRSYVDVLPNLKFLEVINNTRFLKTVQAYDPDSGSLIVIKILIKPPEANIKLETVTEKLAKEASLLAPHANLLPWSNITETDSAGYLVRQMVKTNLYDRLSLRPFLTACEKQWLVFQMLKIIQLLHDDLCVCHGDLKTENFLVTSSNWLVLTDFSQHIKPAYLPDDNPSEFVFYFDSSNRRSCYIAPERFYSKASSYKLPGSHKDWTVSKSADLFSLGCVIAELYMDGDPIFTLSDLYRYKKGDSDLHLSGIVDSTIQRIVRNLLSLDPDSRCSASEILEEYTGTFFPEYFETFLHGFMTDLNTSANHCVSPDNENTSASDSRIQKIYSSFDQIAASFCLDYSEEPPREAPSDFPHLKLNLKGMPMDYSIRSLPELSQHSDTKLATIEAKESQGALILLDTIFSLVSSIRRPANKVMACELILALSERVNDESKLDRSLPYLCSFLDEAINDASIHNRDEIPSDPSSFPSTPSFSSRVASVALVAMTNLLQSCSSINAINAYIFPEFIFPKLKSLVYLQSPFKDELDYLKSTLAYCLPYLTMISDKFTMFAASLSHDSDQSSSLPEEGFGAVSVRCESDAKELVEALLTDSNVNVRIRLVKNILPVCQFFGVDKASDIILPHLITYLNDSSFQLRLAFLSSVKSIGNFIGVLSFEQYLLPLLIQTLGDHEAFVVLKVLEIFVYFVSERLINPMSEFNALSIYKELLTSSLPLLLQPNEWIRQSVTCLILAISNNLSLADNFCFLYPLIKTYLSYDISIINWDTLYPCLTKPLSKQVFELALTWLSKSSAKSLFWKQSEISVFRANGKRQLVSFSKDMGKSIYIGNSSSDSSMNVDGKPNFKKSLTHADRQWILKMKSIGMDEKDLWKVFALRSYLLGINRSSIYNEAVDQRNFELATSVNIPPLTIFFEVRYKSEPLNNRQKGTDLSYEQQSGMRENSIHESTNGSLLLPNGGKAKASLRTNEANVFAELNNLHEDLHMGKSHSHLGPDELSSNSSNRVFSISNEKIVSANVRHNFKGTNPYVRKYLQTFEFEPSLNEFPEFGHAIKNSRDPNQKNECDIAVRGTQVTHINTNTNPHAIDAVTKIVVCPSSEFFITGTESGKLKVWDTSKLDTMSAENAALSLNLGHRIIDLVFLPQRFVFAVSTSDGQVRLFRMQIVRGKSRKIVKFSKLAMIRILKLEKEYAQSLSFAQADSRSLLIMITNACRIVGFDIIKSEKVFELQNPPHYGVPTTFICPDPCSWLLLGTMEGNLCLWDLRFQILLRSWQFASDQISERPSEIKKLVALPAAGRARKGSDHFHFAMIGGCEESDITVWEMPSFECTEIMSANQDNPKIKKYMMNKISGSKEENIEQLISDLSIDVDQPEGRGNTSLHYIAKGTSRSDCAGHLATSTGDNRIIIWNLEDASKSISLQSIGKSTFSKSQMTSRLSFAYEKLEPKDKGEKKVKHLPTSDTITDIALLTKPYDMLLIAEQSGSIRIYK